MTDQEDVRALVRLEVAAAVAPLRAELDRLRAELEGLRGAGEDPAPAASAVPGTAVQDAAAPAETPRATASEPAGTSIPPERDDFARMLRRGLEEEARRSADDADRMPAPKKGWNPFRR